MVEGRGLRQERRPMVMRGGWPREVTRVVIAEGDWAVLAWMPGHAHTKSQETTLFIKSRMLRISLAYLLLVYKKIRGIFRKEEETESLKPSSSFFSLVLRLRGMDKQGTLIASDDRRSYFRCYRYRSISVIFGMFLFFGSFRQESWKMKGVVTSCGNGRGWPWKLKKEAISINDRRRERVQAWRKRSEEVMLGIIGKAIGGKEGRKEKGPMTGSGDKERRTRAEGEGGEGSGDGQHANRE